MTKILEQYQEVINDNREEFIGEFIYNPFNENLLDVHWNKASMIVSYFDFEYNKMSTTSYVISLWLDFYERYKK